MANQDTVEYLVRALLKAGVSREQILMVSRECAWLFGVKSKTEAERITEECLDEYESNKEWER